MAALACPDELIPATANVSALAGSVPSAEWRRLFRQIQKKRRNAVQVSAGSRYRVVDYHRSGGIGLEFIENSGPAERWSFQPKFDMETVPCAALVHCAPTWPPTETQKFGADGLQAAPVRSGALAGYTTGYSIAAFNGLRVPFWSLTLRSAEIGNACGGCHGGLRIFRYDVSPQERMHQRQDSYRQR